MATPQVIIDGVRERHRLLINPAACKVFLGGRRLTLTSAEFRLLHVLVENRSTVVTHRILGKGLWGNRLMAMG